MYIYIYIYQTYELDNSIFTIFGNLLFMRNLVILSGRRGKEPKSSPLPVSLL